MSPRLSSGILMLLLLAGCAAAGPRQGQTAREETRLLLTDVADTLRLVQALDGDPRVGARADSAVVGIRYDSIGALCSVTFDHPHLSREESWRVERMIRERLRPNGPPRGSGRFLLLNGDPSRLAPFEPEEEEPPRMLNRTEIAHHLALLADRGHADRRITVLLLVDSEGRIEEARVARGSGSVSSDQALLGVARRARFSPARLGGIPVTDWVRLPLGLRASR